jgi:hypothetical protein
MPEHNFGRSAAQATKDRATGVAADIILVITKSLRDWLHGDTRTLKSARPEIEALLREFEGAVRQTCNEHEPPTDNGNSPATSRRRPDQREHPNSDNSG